MRAIIISNGDYNGVEPCVGKVFDVQEFLPGNLDLVGIKVKDLVNAGAISDGTVPENENLYFSTKTGLLGEVIEAKIVEE